MPINNNSSDTQIFLFKMDKQSLENAYLKESPLTSTKNKFLLQSSGYSEKYSFPKRLFNFGITYPTMKRKSQETNDKTSTENKFLKNYISVSNNMQKKLRLTSKKKKKKKYAIAEHVVQDSVEVDGLYTLEEMMDEAGSNDRCAFFGNYDLERDRDRDADWNHSRSRLCTKGVAHSSPAPTFSFGSPRGFGSAPGFQFGSSGPALLPQHASQTSLKFAGLKKGLPGFSSESCIEALDIEILEMPVYEFESDKKFKVVTPPLFDPRVAESNLLQVERIQSVKTKKMQFLNAISMALICSSNLKDVDDSYRIFIQKCADDVRAVDPEFILKVALYSRQEMHIRSASNFLLSYAAYHEDTRPYLGKYFYSCINLPTDWIEVADLYQSFHDERLKNGSLPTALKKVMIKSFIKFDAYQLAKYNRDKTKKRRCKEKNLLSNSIDTDTKEERDFNVHSFTLKQLIRLLHLSSPPNEIMCLLGKKYPETAEAFKKSGLSGAWDSKRAGQRMKLPIPETWETQISSHGNKAYVWEGLIDNTKLPYMAMIRNLRNLILSGISPKHHEKVIHRLENKNAVINSKQLPLQFYEAFKTVVDIKELLTSGPVDFKDKSISSRLWGKKTCEKISNASHALLKRYEDAVSNALEISVLHNLQPIPGKTLVICDVFLPKELGIKRKNKAFHLCIMMGLMCLKACEDCEMSLIYGDFFETVVLGNDHPFLQSMMNTCSKHEKASQYIGGQSSVSALKSVLEFHLKHQTVLREKLDQVIYLGISGGENNYEIKAVISSFLHKYRQIVNPKLLYTDVNLAQTSYSFTDTEKANGRDVYLFGNSTQLIKFIAERSSGEQLTFVDNIDSKYNLISDTNSNRFNQSHAEISTSDVLPLYSKVPKWRTVKIFISSTFKDMHCERDMLIRYVMPELRKRAASVFVKINEVDLRWGITEADCATKRASEVCLIEAQNSELFIGMLGDRYGSTYNFEPPDSPYLQWVKDYPRGLSITELEMHAGALRENKLSEKRAFFYLRDNKFLNFVPLKWKSCFNSESEESKQKVEDLKSKIRSSGVKVLDGYGCRWAGILSGKPILAGLDGFGKAVLEDLWNAVCKMHENDPYMDDIAEEEIYQQHLLDSFDYYVKGKNSSMDSLIKGIRNDCGIFLISGAPGSGKTTFVVNMLKELRNFSIIKFFVGLTPRSTDLSYMLQYISNSISRHFPVSEMFPKLAKDVMNHFPDILHEAVNSSGNRDIILVIDGLDHLEVDDQMLDWLPHSLPHGLRLVFTASDSSYAFKVLCERQMHGNAIHIDNLITMVQSDRECIVRHYLKLYGKVLDESPFNNQMLLLVTKKDSGIPLYLRISCDFLRSYASFESFMSTLQSLPSTIPLVFQEIILQMENEFSTLLVQSALTLLCITKEGLDDADLHFLLSLVSLGKGKESCLSFKEAVMKVTEIGPDDLLSQVTYCSLMHTICTFAFGHNRFKKFNLNGSEFEKAVKKFYLNKNYSNFSKYMHHCLAAYYFTLCDPMNDGLWNGHSALAFRSLIYHLYHGQYYQTLAEYLSSLMFLKAIFSVEAADSLLEYYSLLLDKCRSTNTEAVREIDFTALSSFNDFVARNLHIFQSYPHLVLQQALNETSDSLVKLKLTDSKSFMVECLSLHTYDPRVATLGGFVKNITAATCEETHPRALLGSEDGYLKVLDFTSKRIVRSVKSHTSGITFICLAGKNRICTASTDTTLSIWSTADYNRVAVLTGHRYYVSCCCADLSSNILLSSGWDNSVRLWSLRDGRSISVIDTFRCPVNCLDHHPMKQLVACGLWNGNIEIWDTVSLKRMLILESNHRSVKSITYTPDGINIISSYMNSDVVVWSSEQGLKMSSLKGHVLPVKSISYSYLGNMIISGSDDCTLKIWPNESGLSVCTMSSCKFCPISILEIISPNCLAVGYQNAEIWVMDIHNGCILSKMILQSDMASCFSRSSLADCDSYDLSENWVDVSLVFGTQSGKLLVGNFLTSLVTTVGSTNARITSIIHNKMVIICGNSDGDIGVFSYPAISSRIVYAAHKGSVSSLSLSVQNRNLFLASAATDKMMKYWIVDEKEVYIDCQHEYISKHMDNMTCCCAYFLFNDLSVLKFLTGSHDNNVILQSDVSEIKFQGLKTSVVSVAFNDTCIIGCGSDGSIAMWSNDQKLLSYIPGIEQSSAVLCFRIDKDAANDFDITLAFADIDGSVKVRKPIQRSFCCSLEGHSKSITSCCASSSGEILSSSLDGTVNLWKIPHDTQSISLHHSTVVTDIIISMSSKFALSSDAHGNIVLWEFVPDSPDSPLIYTAKKSYTCGYVTALSWLQDKKFVCAVSQILDHEEKHFLDIVCFDYSSMEESDTCNLPVKCSHYFGSEILCLDTVFETNTIVAGFKSGDMVVITADMKRLIKTSEDWILGTKIVRSEDSIEYLFCSLLNGTVKRFETEKVLNSTDFSQLPFRLFPPSHLGDVSPYNSAFVCENEERVFCGDTQGYLRIYTKSGLNSKKVHDDSLTGISVIDSYVFTCSLDRTVKGWNSTTLEQVCQFHSSVPITCIMALRVSDISDSSTSYFLSIGTTSGAVYALKFYPD